jgi:IS4 transposase
MDRWSAATVHNRWGIYSFMKEMWLEHGIYVTREELERKYSHLEQEELTEGMEEFKIAYEDNWKAVREEYERL